MQMWVQYPDRDDPLEEDMATHSSILAWRIPEHGRLQSTGSQSLFLSPNFFICRLTCLTGTLKEIKEILNVEFPGFHHSEGESMKWWSKAHRLHFSQLCWLLANYWFPLHIYMHILYFIGDFPGGASGKGPACQFGLDPWVGKIPWKRAWQPTPVSACLENPVDRGAWRATVHGVTKSRTQLID